MVKELEPVDAQDLAHTDKQQPCVSLRNSKQTSSLKLKANAGGAIKAEIRKAVDMSLSTINDGKIR